jgi:hypothetical protein
MASQNSCNTNFNVGTDRGIVNLSQPAFFAYLSATASNVTGDSTAYTVIFDSEIYDVGANYNVASGIFTASISGKYYLSANAIAISQGTGEESYSGISTSNRTLYGSFYPTRDSCSNFYGPNSGISLNSSSTSDMDAGDTAKYEVTLRNGTKVDDIYGTNSPYTYFCGYLLS